MHNLTLPDLLPSGHSWTEEIPPGSVSRFQATFGSSSGLITLPIKIQGTWRNIASAIKQIIGYSEMVPRFDPLSLSQQGPYRLTRVAPARHPYMAGMRATKILSVVGGGLRTGTGDGMLKASPPQGLNDKDPKRSEEGTYGQYQFVWLVVQFENPRYAILSDNELELAGLHGPAERVPEYKRYCEWDYDTSLETIARKGERWAFCLGRAIVKQDEFAGDRHLKIPRGVITMTWHDVHQDYVFNGRLVPTNYHNRIGTVNSRPFPASGFRDINLIYEVGSDLLTAVPVQFRAGTCLLESPKITASAQNHPAVVSNEINADYFPRSVTVQTKILVFDPPSSDTTTVDLSGNDFRGNARNGQPFTLIRGHNLVPSVMPGIVAPHVGNRWWAARRMATAPAAVPGPPSSDADLLYQYTDFESLWLAPESIMPLV